MFGRAPQAATRNRATPLGSAVWVRLANIAEAWGVPSTGSGTFARHTLRRPFDGLRDLARHISRRPFDGLRELARHSLRRVQGACSPKLRRPDVPLGGLTSKQVASLGCRTPIECDFPPMTDPYPGHRPSGAPLASNSPGPRLACAPTGDGLEWLRGLDRQGFEQLIATSYQLLGYRPLGRASGGDGDSALVLGCGAERLIIQCKHFGAAYLGVNEARELQTLAVAHNATWALLATAGQFDPEAANFAQTNRLTLLDGPAVAQLAAIGKVKQPSPVPTPKLSQTAATASPQALRTGPNAGRAKRLALILATASLLPLVGIGAAVSTNLMAANAGSPREALPAALVSTPAETAQLGEQPQDIAYEPTQSRLYTANYLSGDVSIASAKSGQVLKTIDVPGKPIAVAVDASHHRIFVANAAAAKIYVIDYRSGKTKAIINTVTKPTDLAFDANRQRLFVISKRGQTLSVFNTSTLRRLGVVRTGERPVSLTLDPTDRTAYVLFADHAGVYSQLTLARRSVVLSLGGHSLAIDSVRQRLYITTATGVNEHNLRTGESRSFGTDSDAGAIDINPTKRIAYLADPINRRIETVNLR